MGDPSDVFLERMDAMLRAHARKIAGLFVAALVLGLPSVASAVEIRFRAELNATAQDPLASGHADWRLDTQTGQRRLSVEVEDVASTNQAYATVNGRFVGVLNIVNGFADLNLDSQNGNPIPRATTGTVVQVRRSSDNVLILSGTFQPD
jgi:hypothetical protein